MIEAAEVVELLSKTSGSNDKMYILKKNENVHGLKEILAFIYNPYVRTGISSSKLFKAMGMELPKNNHQIDYAEAIEYFTNHRTGCDADLVFARMFTFQPTKPEVNLAKAIITQDLKIGISATTLNKVYGDSFIPKVGCMLGTLYADVKEVHWPCVVTEKFDGIRRMITKEKGVCRAYSRSGHEDTGLSEILSEISQLPDNTMYDGELLAKGDFVDSIAQRQATNSIANSSGEKTGLTFNMFDMVPINDFHAGVSKDPAINRKILLGATMRDESIQLLNDNWAQLIPAFGVYNNFSVIRSAPILGLVTSLDEVAPIVEKIWARGGEGVMLNTTTGLYEIKRSKELIKIKHTEEHVLKVIDFNEGSGDLEGSLGSLVVDYNGVRLGVSGRMTRALRQHIWSHQDEYLGREVEFDTFGESINATGTKSLNCPIFKRFVGDEE